jgi:hypothetical protein
MSTAVTTDPRIGRVEVTDETITAYLLDGRVVSVPLAWSWRLSDATPAQRAKYTLIGDGQGVHWPDIDEDLSAEGLLHGIPARRPSAGAAKTAEAATSGRATRRSAARPRSPRRQALRGGRG